MRPLGVASPLLAAAVSGKGLLVRRRLPRWGGIGSLLADPTGFEN